MDTTDLDAHALSTAIHPNAYAEFRGLLIKPE